MSKKRKKSPVGLGRMKVPVAVYIAVCLAGVFILVGFFNMLIENHDKTLSQQSCGLLAEKVSSAFSYLDSSASDMAAIIANDRASSFPGIYRKLSASKSDASYTSIGLILNDGTVLAADSEKKELEDQGIVASALKNNAAVSKPYRSVMNGQIVFTVLSSIVRDGEKVGSVFITYNFNRISELAYSGNVDSKMEVWLMDLQSLNVIHCSGPNSALIGVWSNLNLNEEISKNSEYIQCIENIQSGSDTESVTYTEEGETFTQVFKKIAFMDGWSVVVRIPNRAFSSTMRNFRAAVIIFSVFIITATIMMLLGFRRRTEREKAMLEKLTREVIKAFATAVDFKDPYTAGHSKRVGEYSREIARRMGMSEEECRDVYYSGLLHDVGKLGIDNTIINKPDKLDEAEFNEIKKHPDMGYEILKGISLRENYAVGAKYHHERVDGKGYPDHETEIPLIGRIISVADAYDAMTSKRSYRDALPQDKVREQIVKNSGTQFDEDIAAIMIKMIDEDVNYDLRQK